MEVRIVGCMDNTMDNTFESANRVYDKDGLCPTIPTGAGGGHTPKVIDCVNKEESVRQRSIRAKLQDDGSIRFYKDDARKSGVSELQLQNGDGVACTITTTGNAKLIEFAKTTRGSDVVSTIRASYYKNGERNITENVMTRKGYEGVVESRCVRLVGRNPEHPTNRTAGLPTEQRLEPVEQDGVVNALTTVQKDNLVLEKKPELQCRIRKLTPRSCWRLMGYKDSDFDRASEVNSSTQLYKQAGNAIVKQVLMAVFLQLGIQGKKRWNEMTVDERQELVDGSLDFLEDER